MRSAILGAGFHVPARVVTNDDLAKMFDTNNEWIVQRTGIEQRRYIEQPGTSASDLAIPASERALDAAGVDRNEIDAIIFATLSPDYLFPGSAVLVQKKMGLKPLCALDVRNQCSGFLYSLSIADAWVRTGTYKRVLVIGSEVHSSGLDFTDRGRDVTVIFGDGAGAVVVGPTEDPERGILSSHLYADGAFADDLWVPSGPSSHTPWITHEMLDEGLQYPKMNGKLVFRWAAERMPEVAHECLKANGLTIADLDLLIPHQANLRITQMVAMKLGIDPTKVVSNIERYGNTTAASIPIALSEAIADGRAKPGSLILMVAFGAGFTWGATLLRL